MSQRGEDCVGPWVSIENLLSLPQTVGGLLQGTGAKNDMTRVVF